jgi:hypothetical protein
MNRCHWWNRWWHRELRRADRKFMIDTIMEQSDTLVRKKMFDKFIHQPGQEHWLCECAREDRECTESLL